MLTQAVESYVALRRSAGFAFGSEASLLRSFAAFSEASGEPCLRVQVATRWAGLARSVHQRARRLGVVIRFARYLHAEDRRNEIPQQVFGAEKAPRPVPYILSPEQIRDLIRAASQSGYRTLLSGVR